MRSSAGKSDQCLWLGMRDIAFPRCSSVALSLELTLRLRRMCELSLHRTLVRIAHSWGSRSPDHQQDKSTDGYADAFILAGDEGFEPPITGPEPVALPLG